MNRFDEFMWKVFPFVFWPLFFGILIINLSLWVMTVLCPDKIGKVGAELLTPIIEKIKE